MKFKQLMATCILGVGFLESADFASSAIGAVKLTNQCNNEPTAVTTPCGTKVEFEIKDLKSENPLNIQIEYMPAWSQNQPYRVFKRTIKSFNGGAWSESRNFHLFDENSNEPNYWQMGRQWKIVMSWRQKGEVDDVGSAISYVFITPKNVKDFYSVKNISKDARVCTWRTKVELLSGYLYNREAFDLEVSQEIDLRHQLAANGLQVDSRLEVGTPWMPKHGPLIENEDYGKYWFIGGLSDFVSAGSSMTLKLNKMVPQNQGGFFVRRTIYSRYEAKHLRLVDKSGLFSSDYEWEHMNDGFLDVPEVVTEFAFIPLAEAESVRKSLEVLETTVMPNTDNCADKGFQSGNTAFKVESRSSADPMYFYAK